MPYGQGQMLGAGVDPRMFVQDYSGFTRAADIQAQGMQNLGAAIGNVAGQVGDYFKQQGEKKKLIKQSDVQIDAALKLFPDLAPTLQNVRDQIKDENISINDRAAIAESVAGLIQMGTNQMRFQSEQGWKQKEYELSRQAFDVTRSKTQSEIESKAAEERQANSIATAEALGSLNALKKVESDTGNKFVPDDISTAINDLVSSGQGKAAAALINKYLDRLDPAIKAEFATKKAQTPVNIALPGGGSQQMVPNAKGEYEPVRIAGFGSELEAGVLPTETPLTATRADAEPLTINDVPRGAEKTNEVTVGGETYEVYVDKNSPLEPYDIFGVTLPNFENAPKEQWTNQGKYLVRKQPTTEPAKTVGPGTVGYAPEKTMRPTKTPEEELQTQRWTTLDKLQSDIRATGVAAAQDIAPFKEIAGLLDTNVKTGFGRQTIMAAKKVLGADVSNDEQFQARVGELAMRNIALTKGAISDREMDYFKNVLSPNMGKTTEGNKKIIEFKIKYAERADTIAKTISKMQSQGADPYAIQSEIDKIIQSTPLVTVGSTPTSQSSQAESDASFLQGFQTGE